MFMKMKSVCFCGPFFLYFLLTSSNVILNNYAETAFLKRYGVEYLPIVYMLNSIALFFIMGAMTGIMVRVPGARILSYLFVFCGVSVAGIRFLIPFDIDLIYPALFMLKAQYEALLGLLFWNLANDLFNTRQSKRLVLPYYGRRRHRYNYRKFRHAIFGQGHHTWTIFCCSTWEPHWWAPWSSNALEKLSHTSYSVIKKPKNPKARRQPH